jgi:PhnB protein
MTTVKPVPENYHTVTPYLTVGDAQQAIAFYQQAFNATELMRLVDAGGKVGHAELQIGSSKLMLSDEYPEMDICSPKKLGGSATSLHLYVEDANALFEQAIAAGATVVMPLADQFYGDRSGKVLDPFGHSWTIASHQEDLSPTEVEQRFTELYGEGCTVSINES